VSVRDFRDRASEMFRSEDVGVGRESARNSRADPVRLTPLSSRDRDHRARCRSSPRATASWSGDERLQPALVDYGVALTADAEQQRAERRLRRRTPSRWTATKRRSTEDDDVW